MNLRLRRLVLLAVVPLLAVASVFVTAQHSTDAGGSNDVTGNWMITLTHPNLTESYCAARMSQYDRSVVAVVTCLGLAHPLLQGQFGAPETELHLAEGDEFTITATVNGRYLSGGWTTVGLAGPGTATGTRVPLSFGDANCDLRMDATDAMLVMQYAGRYIHESRCLPFGDIDQNGYVEGFDRGQIFGDASIILYYTSLPDSAIKSITRLPTRPPLVLS